MYIKYIVNMLILLKIITALLLLFKSTFVICLSPICNVNIKIGILTQTF
jgi:hypothetical protein